MAGRAGVLCLVVVASLFCVPTVAKTHILVYNTIGKIMVSIEAVNEPIPAGTVHFHMYTSVHKDAMKMGSIHLNVPLATGSKTNPLDVPCAVQATGRYQIMGLHMAENGTLLDISEIALTSNCIPEGELQPYPALDVTSDAFSAMAERQAEEEEEAKLEAKYPTGSVTIFPIGDHLILGSDSSAAWRPLLAQTLEAQGVKVTYAGSRTDSKVEGHPNHEAHAGWSSEMIRLGSPHCKNEDGKGCALEHWIGSMQPPLDTVDVSIIMLGIHDSGTNIDVGYALHMSEIIHFLQTQSRVYVCTVPIFPEMITKVTKMNAVLREIIDDEPATIYGRPTLVDIASVLSVEDFAREIPLTLGESGERKVAQALARAIRPDALRLDETDMSVFLDLADPSHPSRVEIDLNVDAKYRGSKLKFKEAGVNSVGDIDVAAEIQTLTGELIPVQLSVKQPQALQFYGQRDTLEFPYPDEVILNAFFRLADGSPYRHGTFAEIGAFDGVTFSNTAVFERELGWHGVLVEPHPRNIAECRRNRPAATLLTMAVCTTETTMTLQGSGAIAGLQSWINDRNHGFAESTAKEESVQVRCGPIGPYFSLLGIEEIAFMSIDVEGSEIAVLKSIDFSKLKVYVLIIELVLDEEARRTACQSMLRAAGFMYVGRASDLGPTNHRYPDVNEVWVNPLNRPQGLPMSEEVKETLEREQGKIQAKKTFIDEFIAAQAGGKAEPIPVVQEVSAEELRLEREAKEAVEREEKEAEERDKAPLGETAGEGEVLGEEATLEAYEKARELSAEARLELEAAQQALQTAQEQLAGASDPSRKAQLTAMISMMTNNVKIAEKAASEAQQAEESALVATGSEWSGATYVGGMQRAEDDEEKNDSVEEEEEEEEEEEDDDEEEEEEDEEEEEEEEGEEDKDTTAKTPQQDTAKTEL